MDSHLASYTQRRSAIAAILEPNVQVSQTANTTSDSNPLGKDHGLNCTWGRSGNGDNVSFRFCQFGQ